MTINLVGNFQNSYVGEQADEVHIADALESFGYQVNRLPRDEWKARCDGEVDPKWNEPVKSDINIICKWHHFNDGKYVNKLREASGAPVVYWVWDWMADGAIIPWHEEMALNADLYLGNDVMDPKYIDTNIKYQYFPFDCYDDKFPPILMSKKDIDVAFFGSYLGQGVRKEFIPLINKIYPVTVFAFNHEEWQAQGINAHPAVWGKEFVDTVSRCKIILGMNVTDDVWGYWSNRVGKTLGAGGFLLQRYVPGMELFLHSACRYFRTTEEALVSIEHYLEFDDARSEIARRGRLLAEERFTFKARIRDLTIILERLIQDA